MRRFDRLLAQLIVVLICVSGLAGCDAGQRMRKGVVDPQKVCGQTLWTGREHFPIKRLTLAPPPAALSGQPRIPLTAAARMRIPTDLVALPRCDYGVNLSVVNGTGVQLTAVVNASDGLPAGVALFVPRETMGATLIASRGSVDVGYLSL